MAPYSRPDHTENVTKLKTSFDLTHFWLATVALVLLHLLD